MKEMVALAEILSTGFSFVRVDFYYANNTVYFGEMTFTPANGRKRLIPNEYDYILGDQITLPFEK